MKSESPEEFWARAATKSSINRLQIVLGQDDRLATPPPTWGFDGPTGQDETQAVLDGKRTVITSRIDSLTGLPAIGDLSILTWPDGSAAALLSTTGVEVREWDEIDDEIAQADGAKDRAEWEEINGSEPTQVVVEHIRVMFE